jgi:hypothetical protein
MDPGFSLYTTIRGKINKKKKKIKNFIDLFFGLSFSNLISYSFSNIFVSNATLFSVLKHQSLVSGTTKPFKLLKRFISFSIKGVWT